MRAGVDGKVREAGKLEVEGDGMVREVSRFEVGDVGWPVRWAGSKRESTGW